MNQILSYTALLIASFMLSLSFSCNNSKNVSSGQSTLESSNSDAKLFNIVDRSRTSKGTRFFDVTRFGASGNGETDDSQAIQEALTLAGQSNHGVVYFPAGTYLLKEIISWERTDQGRDLAGLVIRGEGAGKTIILVDNEKGGIYLDDPQGNTQFQIRDLTLCAARAGAGTAIAVGKEGNRHGDIFMRCFTGENIEIRGSKPDFYFREGLKVTSCFRPLYRNISFTGAEQADSMYKSTLGISADWCYSPEFESCTVKNSERAFSFVCLPHEPPRPAPEAGTFHRCVADDCGIGIDIDNPSPEPELAISHCMLRTTETGIRLSMKKFYQVRDNIFEPATDPSIHEYKDISTLSSFMGVYHRNIFRRYAGNNSDEINRTCISFDEPGWKFDNEHMIIMNNVFPDGVKAVGGGDLAQTENTSIIKENVFTAKPETGIIGDLLYSEYAEPVSAEELEIRGPVFSVADYGSAGNGIEDDAEAFQAAANELAAEGKGVLYIPAGKYMINKKIAVTFSENTKKGSIAILGEGPGISMIICNNEEGIFDLNDLSGLLAFDLRNFGVYANKNHSTAIRLVSKNEGLPEYRSLTVRSVDIKPYRPTYEENIHFRNGIIATGFSKPLIYNYLFNSIKNRRYSVPFGDMTDYGLYLENCSALTFYYTYVWRARNAIFIKGETNNHSYFFRTRVVENHQGVSVINKKHSEGLWMENCHVNNGVGNILVENMSKIMFLDNLPYGDSPGIPYGPEEIKIFDYDYHLINCRDGAIIGNVYQRPTWDNYDPLPESNRKAVVLEGDNAGNILIEKNIHNAKGKILVMKNEMDGILARDNLYPNPQAMRPTIDH